MNRILSVAAIPALCSMGAAAQPEPVSFDVGAVQAQGVGCRFQDGAAGPADAFLIANGSQITAIFTQLGGVFRGDRRTGELESGCWYRVPGVLEAGHFISAIEQTVTYGLVKSQGVGVRLSASTNYARRLPNGKSHPADLRKNLASAEVAFAPAQEINVALDTLSPVPVRFRRGASGDTPFSRFCNGERSRAIDALQGLQIRLDRRTPDAQVTVAIDGLDVRYAVGVAVEACGR